MPIRSCSPTQDTFFLFSLRGCGSGEGTFRAAAAARSLALEPPPPTVVSVSPVRPPPPLLPPKTVTPPLPRPPREAKGLALTRETSDAEPGVAAELAPVLAPLADASFFSAEPRVGSRLIVLIVTTWPAQ